MKKNLLIPAALLLMSGSAFSAATITFAYTDSPGEGFMDTNAGLASSTIMGDLGTQRRTSFEAAVNKWGTLITSAVTIQVTAKMDPQTCNANSAVLGSAAATQSFKDFPNAPVANTFYPVALANKISGSDQDGANPDITATFNSAIDNNANCLPGDWYYHTEITDGPAGTSSFYGTVLHEVAHGLGVASDVDAATGQLFGGSIDIYSTFLEDHTTGKNWKDMTDGERVASAINTGNLHWIGPQVNAKAASLMFSGGYSNGHVQMYAPNPLEGGSSVSHFDSAYQLTNGNNELMEPSASPNTKITITDELLRDIGWTSALPVELQSFEID